MFLTSLSAVTWFHSDVLKSKLSQLLCFRQFYGPCHFSVVSKITAWRPSCQSNNCILFLQELNFSMETFLKGMLLFWRYVAHFPVWVYPYFVQSFRGVLSAETSPISPLFWSKGSSEWSGIRAVYHLRIWKELVMNITILLISFYMLGGFNSCH